MPAGEKVSVVDGRDRVVGSSTVEECLEKGFLHRAVAVLVIRMNGKYLLQRRSRKDRWHPGLWTLSSTGHVKEGEPYVTAAARELKEELGLTSRITRVGKHLLPPLRSRGLTEWEWVAFYVTKTDSPCIIDPLELDSVEEFDRKSLHSLMEGDTITPDAMMILREYLKGSGKSA